MKLASACALLVALVAAAAPSTKANVAAALYQTYPGTASCPGCPDGVCPNQTAQAACETNTAIVDHVKASLAACAADVASNVTEFAIGHRGAMQLLPEHSMESYAAAIEQGAGFVECDVAPTMDGELVCRHSSCDLATTTNILETDLAEKCSVPFTPGTGDADDVPAEVKCCTYDITLDEYKTLCAIQEPPFNAAATELSDALGDAPGFRSSHLECATPVTHAESAAMIAEAGRGLVPELKDCDEECQAAVGMSLFELADKLAMEVAEAADVNGVPSTLQSFDIDVAVHWQTNSSSKSNGTRVVFLYAPTTVGGTQTWDEVEAAAEAGIPLLGSPIQTMVCAVDGVMQACEMAINATEMGFTFTPWTLERSSCSDGAIAGPCGYYYGGHEGVTASTYTDTLLMQYALLHDVEGVEGVFSDLPVTTVVIANCVPPMNATNGGSAKGEK